MYKFIEIQDILLNITQYLRYDYATLSHICIVNKSFIQFSSINVSSCIASSLVLNIHTGVSIIFSANISIG